MREAVEERAGEPLGAEHGRPLVERQIARDQRAASLVALSIPSTKRFIRSLRKSRGNHYRENHIDPHVFTQPGSWAERLTASITHPVSNSSRDRTQ